MKKKKNMVLLVIGAVLLIYILSFFYNAVISSAKNSVSLEKRAPQEYVDLFNAKAQQKLIFDLGASFKLRNNVSIFLFDKEYNLEMTKISAEPKLSFGRDIIESYKNPEGDFPDNKFSWNENDFTVNYNAISEGIASKIYLSLHGDSIKTILKNDSVACYYLKLKEAFVQYRANDVYEIYSNAKSHLWFFTQAQSVSLMFLKKNNSFYFLLLSAKESNRKLDPCLLSELIN
jgi:hypothetical protein